MVNRIFLIFSDFSLIGVSVNSFWIPCYWGVRAVLDVHSDFWGSVLMDSSVRYQSNCQKTVGFAG